MKTFAIASLSAVLVTTVALAYEVHHPNLRDANQATEAALNHIALARQNNKAVEFGGHAERAISLLQQARNEIIEADKWNDAHHR